MSVEAAQHQPVESACTHLVKGTAWGSVTAASAVAIAVIGAGVCIFGGFLLTMDGFLLHKWAMLGTSSLLWAIPLTTGLIVLDVAVTLLISEAAAKKIVQLTSIIKDSCRKSKEHFNQIFN